MNSPSSYKQQFRNLRCCVLLPTYNNAATLHTVLNDVLQYSDDVVVVNDGSTDNTLQVLNVFPQVKIHTYSTNKGKGWALRQGFAFALAQGYQYAIAMDTDGQHFADDLPVMLQMLAEHKNAIVVGARNMDQSSVPGKSSFGNKFSNFWFELETGISLPDTQSGYRLYPLVPLNQIHFFTYKYEFEIEVLVRSAWKGVEVLSVPIKVYYPPAEERVSHFRPFQDFSRISVLNTVLVFWTLIWIKPRDFFRSFQKKSWRSLFKEHLVRAHETPSVKAWSVAVGIFFGIAPFWGFQMWLVLLFAWIFKLNKGLGVLASNISIPPMIPVIIFLSYLCGTLWMGADALHLNYSSNLKVEMIQKNLLQYVLGSFTLAALCGVGAWFITYSFVKRLKIRKAASDR